MQRSIDSIFSRVWLILMIFNRIRFSISLRGILNGLQSMMISGTRKHSPPQTIKSLTDINLQQSQQSQQKKKLHLNPNTIQMSKMQTLTAFLPLLSQRRTTLARKLTALSNVTLTRSMEHITRSLITISKIKENNSSSNSAMEIRDIDNRNPAEATRRSSGSDAIRYLVRKRN